MSDENQSDETAVGLPRERIHRITRPLAQFLHVEAAGGVVLLLATVTALGLANLEATAEPFLALWKIRVGFQFGDFVFFHSLKHWINDGLMVIFFFVVGLEVKRELVLGELREARRAMLPVSAAMGGMLVPAGLFLALQAGEPTAKGWGIPMATDIAFVVGCLSLFGSRVPHGLRVMLLSLAIVDDIGAIVVIAVAYTEDPSLMWLAIGLAGIAGVFVLSWLGIRHLIVYTAVGIFIWFAFHESKIHATIAGVMLGFMTPAKSYISEGLFGDILTRARRVFEGNWEATPHRAEKVRTFRQIARETVSPLEYLEGTLHPWMAFVIMPVFALANAGVPISLSDFGEPVAMAIIVGLAVGKPAGIMLFSWLTVKLQWTDLPKGVDWGMMAAGGMLCGIGFTMAIFIAGLAYPKETLALDTAKVGVLGASVLSAAIGLAVLALTTRHGPRPSTEGQV